MSVAATRDPRPNLICFNDLFDRFAKIISKQFVGVTIFLDNRAESVEATRLDFVHVLGVREFLH